MTDQREDDFEDEVEVGEDNDLDIEVVEDEPDEAKAEPEQDEEELASYSRNVQKRIKKLTYEAREAQREREKLAREQSALTEYTKRTMAENQALKRALNNGQNLIADQLKNRVQTELTLAERKLKDAMELGDFDSQVQAQKEIARLTFEATKAESFKPVAVSEEPPELPRVEEPRSQPSPRAVEWHKRNRWFGSDQTMTQYARHVHDRLVVFDHVDPNSEKYWAKLDEEMQKRFPHALGASEEDDGYDDTPPPRRANVVAPVRRSATPPRKIQLSSTEVAIAKRLGLTLEQYAKEKLKGF